MTRARHLTGQILAVAGILLVICAVAALLIVRSGWFRELVRERIVTEIERATGGHVEVGNFSFKWETLTAKISPLVLHGTEPESETPLLRVESVSVGLRVISMLERKVDLDSVTVDQPRLRIVIYTDGSNNLPSPPGPKSGKSWAEDFVNLKVHRYSVTNGFADIDIRQVPLSFNGQDLRVQMTRDAAAARYRGTVASRRLRISSNIMSPAEADFAAAFTLDATRLALSSVNLALGSSRIDLSGELTNLKAPRGVFKAKAAFAVRDAVSLFSLPVASAGAANFDGDVNFSFANAFVYEVTGRIDARGLGYSQDRVRIQDAALNAALNLNPDRLTLRGLRGTVLGANVTGQAELEHWKDFHFDGNVDGLDARKVAATLTPRVLPWNGSLSGTLDVDAVLGERRTVVDASAAMQGQITGQLDIHYDQRAGTVNFGESRIATPATSLNLSGTLGQTLNVRARSTNLDDVLAALEMFNDHPPAALPLKLDPRKQGEAAMAGLVTGRLDAPQFQGQVTVTNASMDGHVFDRFTADVQASAQAIAVRRLMLARAQTQVTGDAVVSAAAAGDFVDGPLTAQLSVKNLALAAVAREFGIATATSVDADALASAIVKLSGSARNPQADIALDATQATALGEKFERVRGNLHYTAQSIAFDSGQADLGSGKLLFSGAYTQQPGDLHSGDLRMDVTAQAITASRVTALRQLEPGAEARLDGKAALDLRVDRGALLLRSVSGAASARNVTLDKQKLGDVSLTAATSGNELTLQATAQVRDTALEGQGKWRLDGDFPGSGSLKFSRLTVATLHDLVMLRGTAGEKTAMPPFEGFLEGGVTFNVALRTPRNFQADLKIDTLQLNAKAQQALRLDVQAQDVQIHNTQPILVSVTAQQAKIASAHLTARDTNLEVTGVVPFSDTGGANLALNGIVNLGILQLLNADLLAKGTANVNATLRGSLRNPQMNGRLEFANASLYMNDVPNGVDNASGTILFDRNRATIDKLTAETGGGSVAFRGFLEFGDVLIYRLQADVRQVRVRYPEDVSSTSNAQLSLNGTSEASTLSGTVTLNRAAIAAGADLARLLAEASKPSPAPPSPSEYLRGMRFDVRLQSAPLFELETSLTRNVQTEVDLRLRGTPLNPALLGTITVNSGEIQIFGNRYTVNRGDIRFLNPVKIEPTLDLDLETRTRGITVTVTVAGSPQRLAVNYSSDPPLQSNEIIALLAVGRDPTSNQVGGQIATSAASFGSAGSVLGEAVSEQLSNRLQRFFGASRVKIDPTIDATDNLPAARLTLEQQISRDISLTYITNLNRTQEQTVRIQWDFSKQWSAVAVRDSNGLFGIDFLFRKRFK
ncbi:MAG: translocation/assembly module TamB domain-containing protein [Acidobacteriota bacterium]|nr:translocation/assembly module TamB domain-containing protein [Acidobacteriota bacterium]